MKLSWDLLLERQSVNHLREKVCKRQLQAIRGTVERNQSYGLRALLGKLHEPKEIYVAQPATPENKRLLYQVKLRVMKPATRSEEAAQRYFEAMLTCLARTAQSRGWRVVNPENGQEVQQVESGTGLIATAPGAGWVAMPTPADRIPFDPPVLNEEAKASFMKGIYDRDDQLAIIDRGMRSSVANPEEPSHFLLYGPPAGAKTRVFKALKGFYEQDRMERVVILDATTLTKAGLERWLLNRAEAKMLPELLVLEEIEKHKTENLLCLLSVMASGEVSRTNAPEGQRQERARVVIGATCNDEETLKRFHRGALWSRFTHKLYCPRPDRERMRLILLDKIAARHGDPLWADVVLNYAYDEVANDDPRFITGLLDGAESLLDGSYLDKHRRIEATRRADLERRGLLEQKKLEDAAHVIRQALGHDREGVMRMLGLHTEEYEAQA